MLTERRAGILAMLVNEYIDTAAPVSSRALVEAHRLDLSAATIRNELAALEEDGYITHPYTSAGRVPLDSGYRLYVETLMAEEPVPADERRTVEHQFYQASGGLDEWLSLAATVLAGWVGNVAVVTRPQARRACLRNVQLVQLHDEAVLLVAVMDDGRVQQRMMPLRTPTTQQDLSTRAERLNARFRGHDARVVREALDGLVDDDERATAEALAGLIEEHRAPEGTRLEGLQVALEQPEFSEPARMLEAVRHLVAYEIYRVLATAADVAPGAMRVMIGSENPDAWMQDWSVVVSTYGGADAAGTVAVLGPTRMHYARTIPRVRYVATLMSNVMHEVGG